MGNQVTNKLHSSESININNKTEYYRWNEGFAQKYDVDNYLESLSLPLRMIENMRYQRLLNLVVNEKPSFVLDAGCGSGILVKMMLDNKIKPFAMDFSSSNIHRTGKRVETALIQADIQSLPLQNNSMPMIVCTEVIEHLPDPERAIKNMSEALKNNGTLLITVPNELLIQKTKKILSVFPMILRSLGIGFGGPEDQGENLWHLHIFRHSDFKKLLLKYFSSVTTVFLPNFFLPVRWIFIAKKG